MGNDRRANVLRCVYENNRYKKQRSPEEEKLIELCRNIIKSASQYNRADILHQVEKLIRRIEQSGLTTQEIEKKRQWLLKFKNQMIAQSR